MELLGSGKTAVHFLCTTALTNDDHYSPLVMSSTSSSTPRPAPAPFTWNSPSPRIFQNRRRDDRSSLPIILTLVRPALILPDCSEPIPDRPGRDALQLTPFTPRTLPGSPWSDPVQRRNLWTLPCHAPLFPTLGPRSSQTIVTVTQPTSWLVVHQNIPVHCGQTGSYRSMLKVHHTIPPPTGPKHCLHEIPYTT
jgi:hypothetical protein